MGGKSSKPSRRGAAKSSSPPKKSRDKGGRSDVVVLAHTNDDDEADPNPREPSTPAAEPAILTLEDGSGDPVVASPQGECVVLPGSASPASPPPARAPAASVSPMNRDDAGGFHTKARDKAAGRAAPALGELRVPNHASRSDGSLSDISNLVGRQQPDGAAGRPAGPAPDEKVPSPSALTSIGYVSDATSEGGDQTPERDRILTFSPPSKRLPPPHALSPIASTAPWDDASGHAAPSPPPHPLHPPHQGERDYGGEAGDAGAFAELALTPKASPFYEPKYAGHESFLDETDESLMQAILDAED